MSGAARLLVGSSRTRTRLPTAREIDVLAPDGGERRGRAAAHVPPAHERSAHRLDAQQDVLHDRQVRREGELLVDHRHPGRPAVGGRARGVRLRAEAHRAGVRPHRAGEDLHQGALARAVLADQRVHLAGPHRQVDAVQRDRRAERLADPGHVQEGVGHLTGSGRRSRARSCCRA
jgi:hypothetical protein